MIKAEMVTFMFRLDWTEGCPVTGKTLFWGLPEGISGKDQHLNLQTS